MRVIIIFAALLMLASCAGGKTSKSTTDVDSVDMSVRYDTSRVDTLNDTSRADTLINRKEIFDRKQRAKAKFLAKMGKLKRIEKGDRNSTTSASYFTKNAIVSASSSGSTIIPTSPYGFYYYSCTGCFESSETFAFCSSVDYEYFYNWMKKSGYSDDELIKDTTDYWYRITI